MRLYETGATVQGCSAFLAGQVATLNFGHPGQLDAGVAFALDDFGTGCSVLSYLKYFPVSYIKMDKIFTQDILSEKTSRHIVENVVGLAGKLIIMYRICVHV
ncbi:EAL domain-containing protein [Escherichia coli]|nr:EAL domain-containing protein [Escherichia coli]